VIPLAIILPEIRRKRDSIGLRIIRASEHAINSILIQNIRIKEVAEARAAMALRISSRFVTSGSAYGRIIRLRLREGLDSHVTVIGHRRIDRRVAEVDRAGEAWNCHWRFVVDIRAADNDLELGLVLAGVGGLGSGHHRAKESTFDAGDGGWVWAVDVVSVN